MDNKEPGWEATGIFFGGKALNQDVTENVPKPAFKLGGECFDDNLWIGRHRRVITLSPQQIRQLFAN